MAIFKFFFSTFLYILQFSNGNNSLNKQDRNSFKFKNSFIFGHQNTFSESDSSLSFSVVLLDNFLFFSTFLYILQFSNGNNSLNKQDRNIVSNSKILSYLDSGSRKNMFFKF